MPRSVVVVQLGALILFGLLWFSTWRIDRLMRAQNQIVSDLELTRQREARGSAALANSRLVVLTQGGGGVLAKPDVLVSDDVRPQRADLVGGILAPVGALEGGGHIALLSDADGLRQILKPGSDQGIEVRAILRAGDVRPAEYLPGDRDF